MSSNRNRKEPFSEEEMGRVRRNAMEDLVLSRVFWEPGGDEFLRLQSFVRNTTGPDTPTRDRINCKLSVWAELLPAIQEAVKQAAPSTGDPEPTGDE